MTVVFYHGNCADGSGAAAVIRSVLGLTAKYYPIHYSDELKSLSTYQDVLPKLKEGCDIYVVDFSFTKEVLRDLKSKGHKVIVIDHHKTALDELDGEPDCVLDMTKSGAVLTWEYFYPNEEIPHLLKLIQDRDLWNWQMPQTKAFSAAYHAGKKSLAEVNARIFEKEGSAFFTELCAKGEEVLEEQQITVASLVSKAVFINFKGHKVPVVNTDTLVSETGNALCKLEGVDFSLTYFVQGAGEVVASLRSIKGGFDVSALAKELGGGGHQSAAGFKTDLKTLVKLYEGETMVTDSALELSELLSKTNSALEAINTSLKEKHNFSEEEFALAKAKKKRIDAVNSKVRNLTARYEGASLGNINPELEIGKLSSEFDLALK